MTPSHMIKYGRSSFIQAMRNTNLINIMTCYDCGKTDTKMMEMPSVIIY